MGNASHTKRRVAIYASEVMLQGLAQDAASSLI